MYFEPVGYEGSLCWDGGLRENNPIQVAVNEAKTFWGPNAPFDMIVSLGCGEAKKPQPAPTASSWILGDLYDLFKTLLETMNGNATWNKFKESVDQSILNRCSRLNIPLSEGIEPPLDDVGAIGRLEVVRYNTIHW